MNHCLYLDVSTPLVICMFPLDCCLFNYVMHRVHVYLVQAGPSSSPDDSRGRMAESQPCAGPSSSSTTGLGGERQSGCAQAQAPQQDTAGGADLFNSQEIAGNLTGPSQVNMLACERA